MRDGQTHGYGKDFSFYARPFHSVEVTKEYF